MHIEQEYLMNADIGTVVKTGSSQQTDPKKAVQELYDAIYQADVSFAVFYCSANYDLVALEKALAEKFADIPLIGCTTAGEIGPDGLCDDSITGFTMHSENLNIATSRLPNNKVSTEQIKSTYVELQKQAKQPNSDLSNNWEHFIFLLCDGMSGLEERIVGALHDVSKAVPLVGGSAGDCNRFNRTHVYHEGEFHTNETLISLVNTSIPFTAFKTENFIDNGGKKMVVTGADITKRIVTEVNGIPAAKGYAELFDVPVDELTPRFLGAHPVAVKIGDTLYVRSILQKMRDLTEPGKDGLLFACAIDEGVVLTVVEETYIVPDLENAFAQAREQVGEPVLTLGFDCMFRKLKYAAHEADAEIAQIMLNNKVIGFHTYGEQYNSLHVNNTFTAITFGKES